MTQPETKDCRGGVLAKATKFSFPSCFFSGPGIDSLTHRISPPTSSTQHSGPAAWMRLRRTGASELQLGSRWIGWWAVLEWRDAKCPLRLGCWGKGQRRRKPSFLSGGDGVCEGDFALHDRLGPQWSAGRGGAGLATREVACRPPQQANYRWGLDQSRQDDGVGLGQ